MILIIILITGFLAILLDDPEKKATLNKVHKVFCWIEIGAWIIFFLLTCIYASLGV